MGPAVIFGMVLVLALAAQTYGSIRKYQSLQCKFREIKARNPVVSVGRSTYWGIRRTAVLGFDRDGRLQELYLLSGLPLFASFKRIRRHEGEHYSFLKQQYQRSKKLSCIMQAVRYMEELYG